MNNLLEKNLNDYREGLQELNNIDLLFEYKFACTEVERYRQLAKNNPDNKDLQKRLDYEKKIEKICKDAVINRMGDH